MACWTKYKNDMRKTWKTDKVVNNRKPKFTNFLKHNYSTTFYDIDREQTIKIIDGMKPKTSYGFDEISMKLVKSIKYIIVDPLRIVINQMIRTGIFPDLLKIAKVTSIY